MSLVFAVVPNTTGCNISSVSSGDWSALATAKSKAFFRVGVQVYDFKYTGSNNWVGAPVKVSDMQGQMSALAPLSKAYDIYATFEVKF